EIGMVGEGDRGQPDLDCALAAALHRPVGSVVRPLGVNVEISLYLPRFRAFGARRTLHRGTFRSFGGRDLGVNALPRLNEEPMVPQVWEVADGQRTFVDRGGEGRGLGAALPW